MGYRKKVKRAPTPSVPPPSLAQILSSIEPEPQAKPALTKEQREKMEVYLKRPGKIAGDAPDIARDILPGRSYHSSWKSLESYAKFVKSLDEKKAWSSSGWERGSEFSGTESMKEALVLAEKGWKEGTDALDRTRKRISALRPLIPKLSKYGPVGAFPSVPRAIAGNVNNMVTIDKSDAKRKKVITLISNFACLGGISQEAMTNRAALVAVLIDEIESAGFACEVISTALSKGRGDFDVAHTIRVKESSQPVDVTRLAFALGHASLFRRLAFADKGSEKICEQGLGWGFGCSEGFGKYGDSLAEKNIFTIPSANRCSDLFKNEETTATRGIEYLLESLRQQGCPPFKRIKPSKDEAILRYVKNEDANSSFYLD